jgi:hypothetical protein
MRNQIHHASVDEADDWLPFVSNSWPDAGAGVVSSDEVDATTVAPLLLSSNVFIADDCDRFDDAAADDDDDDGDDEEEEVGATVAVAGAPPPPPPPHVYFWKNGILTYLHDVSPSASDGQQNAELPMIPQHCS